MIDHIHFKELASSDFDGQTTPEEKRLLEEHLKECTDCQEYSRQLHRLSATLNEWTNEDLSPDLEQKIQKGLKEVIMQREKKSIPKHPMFKVTVGGGGALVVILVLVLSMQVYTTRGVQGRLKSATDDIGDQLSKGNTDVVKRVAKLKSPMDSSRMVVQQEFSGISGALETKKLASKAQYEPYYLETKYSMSRDESEVQMLDVKQASQEFARVVAHGAAQTSDYQPLMVASESISSANSSRAKAVGKAQLSRYQPLREVSSSNSARGGHSFHDVDRIAPTSPYYNTQFHTEQYDRIYENEFLTAKDNPLSTFSIDVDTASYSNMRRFLNSNQLPPPDAIRIEELINYFTYDYPNPQGEHPFSVTTQVSICPWNQEHQLVQIGLQGKTLETDQLLPSNLVFLIDVSGSMNQANKLPLLKTAFKMLVNQLGDKERVAIVVYAGAAGVVLDSTPGSNKQAIRSAIDQLGAGGSTAGGAGIKLAYKIARENFIKEGNNRVILATDGDFNVGASSNAEMVRLIEEERKAGTFLTVLGFGTGNYKDSRMEQIADKGNGNYYYIDTEREAKKVLVNELGSTLFTIAKDVKLQIEFNPTRIKAYRLIGYENRILTKEDFADDTKDAGELGAGHTVTALYEIVPIKSEEEFRDVDELVYQQTQVIKSNDLMTVKLRYKEPDGTTSKLIKQVVTDDAVTQEPKGDFQFASAVAEFGLLLRDSKFKGDASYNNVLIRARNSKGNDSFGYRMEFINLVEKAQLIDDRSVESPGIQFKNQ